VYKNVLKVIHWPALFQQEKKPAKTQQF